MLTNAPVMTSLPMVDYERTRKFYEETLGLKRLPMPFTEALMFEGGLGAKIFLYKTEPTKATHTVMSFMVENIENEVKELKEKGVVFEKLNVHGMETDENGITTTPAGKSAWFKDSEGNILAITSVK